MYWLKYQICKSITYTKRDLNMFWCVRIVEFTIFYSKYVFSRWCDHIRVFNYISNLKFKMKIDEKLFENNLNMIRQNYMSNYNARVFEIFQLYINIIKNIRINFTFLKLQIETIKQFIVDCMFRDVLQNIKIEMFKTRQTNFI